MIVYIKGSSSLLPLSLTYIYIYKYIYMHLMETQGIYIGQIRGPFRLRFVSLLFFHQGV